MYFFLVIAPTIKSWSTLSHQWKYPLIPGWMRSRPSSLRGLLLFEIRGVIWGDRSYVTYIELCTTAFYDTNHLHATIVDLYCIEGEMIKYSTVKNWYVEDVEYICGIYNLLWKVVCVMEKNQGFCGPSINLFNNHLKILKHCFERRWCNKAFYSVALKNKYQ